MTEKLRQYYRHIIQVVYDFFQTAGDWLFCKLDSPIYSISLYVVNGKATCRYCGKEIVGATVFGGIETTHKKETIDQNEVQE